MDDKILHLFVGIPGSGKSTYAKKFAQKINATYISADEIREELFGDASNNSNNEKVFSTFFSRLNSALKSKSPVVVDNTNYNKKNRKGILLRAKTFHYKVYAYEMNTPHEVSRERNKKRDRVVPDFVMDRMISGYQKPDPSTEYIEKVISVG